MYLKNFACFNTVRYYQNMCKAQLILNLEISIIWKLYTIWLSTSMDSTTTGRFFVCDRVKFHDLRLQYCPSVWQASTTVPLPKAASVAM